MFVQNMCFDFFILEGSSINKFYTGTGTKTEAFERLYRNYKFKISYIARIALFPIIGVRTKHPMYLQRGICIYTSEGRCAVTKLPLKINIMCIHRKNPTPLDELNSYNNLIYILKYVET